ncbi:hypothetical protein T484DRAFT_1969770 [Baffinella frigidus]|nr:hypothetical protein T484DRAFT_1969770 [Cryptophyta sp. CCMP2293]
MAVQREPFGMFLVMVDPDSKFEKLLGVAAMAPYFIMCALAVLLLRCRELLVAVWLSGHLLNEALNLVLKKVIKEPRPPGAPRVGFDEHGMPSSHSQFMGFYLVFSSCVLLFRVRNVRAHWKLGAVAFNALLSAAVLHGRILLGFHTPPQVLVGFGVGCAAGLAYFFLARAVLFPAFGRIARWPLMRLLLARDAAGVDNVMQFEHDAYARTQSAVKSK